MRARRTMRYAQTMAFNTLVFFSLFTVFNARSDERSAFVGMFANWWLLESILLAILLQLAVIYIPVLQQTFSTVSLSAGDWLKCAAVGSSVLWLRELSKLFSNVKHRHSAAHSVMQTDVPSRERCAWMA